MMHTRNTGNCSARYFYIAVKIQVLFLLPLLRAEAALFEAKRTKKNVVTPQPNYFFIFRIMFMANFAFKNSLFFLVNKNSYLFYLLLILFYLIYSVLTRLNKQSSGWRAARVCFKLAISEAINVDDALDAQTFIL